MSQKTSDNDTAVLIRVPSDLKKACEDAAKVEGISLNAWIRKTLTEKITGKISTESTIRKLEIQQQQINDLNKKIEAMDISLTLFVKMINEK